MSKYNKSYLATFKGQTVNFKIVDYSGDIKVKFVDYGETELEVTEVGATLNDQQSYELQRRFGTATILTRYFAKWSI